MSSQGQQHGGMINPIQIFIDNLDSPYKLLIGFVLIIGIVYASIISIEIRTFADSIIGRILGIGLIYGIIHSFGWVYGLLATLAFLLILQGSPRLEYVEGFSGGGSINQKKVIGKKWFVETVLGENPKKIETDKVQTSAIEGISSGSLMN
jgi:hypothetical protein